MRGKFIVFYGVNNLGKTTQAKLLVERLKKENRPTEYVKFAVYDLEPSGPLINEYLRKNNPYNFSPREFQILQVLNRQQFQPELIKKLTNGINVVAEDYVGTGLAWGSGEGVDENLLKKLNRGFCREDLAFLFTGERFQTAAENGHVHEKNGELIEKVRRIHERLGRELGWLSVNANQPIETVAEIIWQSVKKNL